MLLPQSLVQGFTSGDGSVDAMALQTSLVNMTALTDGHLRALVPAWGSSGCQAPPPPLPGVLLYPHLFGANWTFVDSHGKTQVRRPPPGIVCV